MTLFERHFELTCFDSQGLPVLVRRSGHARYRDAEIASYDPRDHQLSVAELRLVALCYVWPRNPKQLQALEPEIASHIIPRLFDDDWLHYQPKLDLYWALALPLLKNPPPPAAETELSTILGYYTAEDVWGEAPSSSDQRLDLRHR